MSTILETLLQTLPPVGKPRQLYLGLNWTLAIIEDGQGGQRAGLAASPDVTLVENHLRFRPGHNPPPYNDALEQAHLALSDDPVQAAVGLATLNALLPPDPGLEELDAGDWLVENSAGKNVAVIGRFPLVEEIRPVAQQLWVFELDPKPGEYAPSEMPDLLPRADILAITSSTLINHTLDGILAHKRPGTQALLLGPSTPLSSVLFRFGVDLLSGVQVVNLSGVLASLSQGVSFRKMQGARRVSLRKKN